MQTTLTTVMAALKSKLNTIANEIPAGRRIVYIDLPIHLNVGDLLINAGTEAFLSSISRQPALRLSLCDYKRFSRLIQPDDVLLLHGGGNMNDIWAHHEDLRQYFLAQFPTNKIIVLPQTVHYKDTEKGKAILQAYANHKDCTLYVRDQPSYDFVTQNSTVRCHLSPDMAHALWSTPAFNASVEGQSELLFIRRDLESSGTINQNHAANSMDWDDVITPIDLKIYHLIYRLLEKNPSALLQPVLYALWYALRNHIVNRSVKIFQSHKTVRTDRLHGIILSCLLLRDIFYIDNSYGKLSGYASAWLENTITRSDA